MPDPNTDTSRQPEQRNSGAAQQTPSTDIRPPWRVDGARRLPRRRPPHRRPSLRVLLTVLLALDWFLVLAYQPSTPVRVTVPDSYFVSQVQARSVATVSAQGSAIQGTLRHSITYPAHNGTSSTLFAANRPTFADDHLLSQLLRKGAVVSARPTGSGSDPWLTILGGVLPTILLLGFWIWIIQRYSGQMGEGGGIGGMFGMGRSKAHKVRGHRTAHHVRQCRRSPLDNPRTGNLRPLMLRNTQEIENDVRAALDRDPRITHPELIAISVDDIGTVDLRGAVDSPPQRRAAARDARQIGGVFEAVVDALEVHPPGTHDSADDQIRALALQRLSRDARIRAEHIHVSVSRGRVTLSGYVSRQSQGAAAAEDVAGLAGVMGVSIRSPFVSASWS